MREQSILFNFSEKKSSKEAFKHLFESQYQPLCSFAIHYIKERHIAEDLVQDAFIVFWERRRNFDNLLVIKAFLYNTVKNRCLNHLKHDQVMRKHESQIILTFETEHNNNHPVIEEETFNSLYNEIKNLPKSAQQIMLLALNGLKNPEIADELGISVNTVKTQKKLAYSKIKNNLSPLHQLFLLVLW